MRITATLVISAALATLTLTAFTVAAMGTAQSASQIETDRVAAPALCAVEAAAYTEVFDLAHSYRTKGDVFAAALDALREQLLDCLATSEMPDDGFAIPSRDGGRSI